MLSSRQFSFSLVISNFGAVRDFAAWTSGSNFHLPKPYATLILPHFMDENEKLQAIRSWLCSTLLSGPHELVSITFHSPKGDIMFRYAPWKYDPAILTTRFRGVFQVTKNFSGPLVLVIWF